MRKWKVVWEVMVRKMWKGGGRASREEYEGRGAGEEERKGGVKWVRATEGGWSDRDGRLEMECAK